MKKILYSLLVVSVFVSSCKKEEDYEKDSFDTDVLNASADIIVSSENYNSVETNLAGDDFFITGTIDYVVDNITEVKVDFSANGDRNASILKGGDSSLLSLNKKSFDAKYNKVIVKPLVKTVSCDFIVEGVIKYYEVKTGEWVATVDYGDGSCDKQASKTTSDGIYVFSLEKK